MTRLLKEPLLHFLLVGLGLFLLYDFVAGDQAEYDSRVIDVNRDTLLTFVQFRTRAFDPAISAQRLDAMSADELQALIDDYVREEALYREALALGTDKNDYIIKRRLIQSIEFITSGFVTAAVDLSDKELRDYYEENRADYYVEPHVTFTHVFFNSDTRSIDEAIALAEAKLAELNGAGVQFSQAPRHGERFPYFVNYVERTPAFLTSHFGTRMTKQLLALEPDESTWQGPFQSPYGAHVVLLVNRQEGRFPEFSEVEQLVRRDAEQAAIDKLNDQAIQAIVDTYEVNNTL
jgi:hypothetical protein